MSINVFPSGIVTDGGNNEDLDNYSMKERDCNVLHIAEGDSRINEFNKRLRGDNSLIDDIQFRLDFIEVAAQLYGDFRDWLKYQYEENTLLYSNNMTLVTDTIRFLITGKRHVELYTHQALLVSNPPFSPGVATKKRWSTLKSEVPGVADFDFGKYIGMWLQHPTGFHDMFYTTWLLFGEFDWRPDTPDAMTFISNV